ncbi:MAG: endo-1,4-beta-xylanase [Candidatus Phocaeicola faecipullorum]|nr:endo-1,4-beta-xylanase [Candidatus Phocaeicola faecipullorum]
MKIYNRLFIGTSLCLAVCSCADQGLLPFPGELQVPDELTQNANLQEYDILKNYVNRTDNPGFKLGIAVDENEFINKGAAFSIAQTNFDDVTPGNAMKYSSVVKDNGTMDFSTVESFIETAEAAGLTVYGHTLCWHSQQNLTYLNGLLRGGASKAAKNYVMSRADSQNKYCLKLTGSGEEQTQAYYEISGTFPSGTYTFSCRTKSSVAISGGNLVLQTSNWEDGQVASWGVFNSSTNWTNVSNTVTIPDEDNNKYTRFFIQFKAGTEDYILIDDISLTRSGDSKNYIDNADFETGNTNGWSSYGNNVSIFEMSNDTEGGDGGDVTYEELLENGDFENGELSSCYNVQNGGTTYEIKVDDAAEHGKVLAVTNPTTQTEDYESQFIFSIPTKAQVGEVYVFSMDIKSDTPATINTQAQSAPGTYMSNGIFGSISTTTEWTTITKEITIGSGNNGFEGLGAVAFNLGLTATTYYIDNISFQKKVIEGEEMTDEEKHDAIYAALEDWIKNMMVTCAGRVKVWDVVNEPISGSGNVDGYYELWSASNSDDPTNNFYWQDYLGDDEFVRDAVKLARKYFAENGGNPNDLKLFVNDYNLESDWDTNKKLRSLIYWIDRWENNGEVYIDGIGTQMHVSCSVKEDTQKSRENAVENMFKLMAQTNKLIKISEIDMGITDEDNKKIMTSDVTLVHLLRMADYYNFIIRKYFEIIPQAQRYGITQWSITDAGDEELAWRQGEPIGLWTKEYERKPAYAGFADGLAGVEKSYLGWASSGNSTIGENPTDDVGE